MLQSNQENLIEINRRDINKKFIIASTQEITTFELAETRCQGFGAGFHLANEGSTIESDLFQENIKSIPIKSCTRGKKFFQVNL